MLVKIEKFFQIFDKIIKKSRLLTNIIKILIIFISFYVVITNVNYLELKNNLISAKFNHSNLIKIFVFLFLVFIFYALRFNILINKNKKKYKINQTLELNLYSNLASQFGIFFNLIVRLLFGSKINISSKKVFKVTILENLLTLIFYFILVPFYIFFFNYNLFIILIFFLVSVYLIYKITISNYLDTFIITIVLNLINFLVIYEVALYIGIKPSNLFIFLIPIVVFLVALPLTPTEWGWREMLFIKIFNLSNVSSEQALILSIIYGLITLIFSIIIVLIHAFFLKTRTSKLL